MVDCEAMVTRDWWEIAKRVATSRRVLVAVADLVVVATIVSVLVFTALVIVRQGAYDGAATDIAAWSRERDVERVAWPTELREAVPALLDAGVVPVLVDGSEPEQQYAISRTGVVVTKAGAQAPALEVASHRVGDLIAYEVAIDEAGSVPLAVGDTVSEKISRPYRYAPLYPSAVIPPGESFDRDLFLEPGRYEVTVEAFVGVEASDSSANLVVAFEPTDGEPVVDAGAIGAIVEEPLVIELVLPEGTSSAVRLRMGTMGAPDSPDALVHAWSVTRLADV